MNRLTRTVFRSILRWGRRREIVGTDFTITPKDLSIEHLLPQNVILKGVEGVQGAAYHCFRNGINRPEDLDLAFNVMKQLNEFHVKIKEEYEQRLVNRNPMFTKYAKYKVGEVVQLKSTGVRAVVVGWEVDPAYGKQKLQLLLDVTDSNEFSTRLREGRLMDSNDVIPVSDPLLRRINSRDLSTFFYYFDEVTQRYVPREQLYQLYLKDFEDVQFGKPLQSEADKKVMQSVTQGIATIGQHLQVILEDQFPSILLPEEHPDVMNNNDDNQINERIISKQILDEIIHQIQNLITPHPTMRPSASRRKPDGDKNGSQSIAVKLLRGGIHRQKDVESEAPESLPYLFSESDQIAIETTYGALYNLQELMRSLDQLLQLRYQSRGMTFFDRLRVKHLDNGEVKIVKMPLSEDVERMGKESIFPTTIFEVGQVVRHRKLKYRGVISGFDQRPLVDATKWDGVKETPLGVHQPFYRIIPDQGDVEKHFGDGRYHPYFYVPQDNLELVHDPSSLIINHKNIRNFFLGWDAETSRFRLPHKLKYCFPCGSQRFDDNYPETTISENWTSQNPSIANGKKEEEKTLEELKLDIISSEIKIYEKIDFVLLELQSQINSMLNETRSHYVSQVAPINNNSEAKNSEDGNHLHFTASDLLMLLRKAPTAEAAFALESVLWFVWATNSNPNISTAIRSGISFTLRGEREKAIKSYELAIKYDPQFAEAYNKIAALYHAQGKHVECLEYASSTLKYFPDHFGALSGMALSHEKLGNMDEAKACIHDALRLHPWAAHIPTILQSIYKSEDEKRRQLEEEVRLKARETSQVADRLEPLVNPPNSTPAAKD